MNKKKMMLIRVTEVMSHDQNVEIHILKSSTLVSDRDTARYAFTSIRNRLADVPDGTTLAIDLRMDEVVQLRVTKVKKFYDGQKRFLLESGEPHTFLHPMDIIYRIQGHMNDYGIEFLDSWMKDAVMRPTDG